MDDRSMLPPTFNLCTLCNRKRFLVPYPGWVWGDPRDSTVRSSNYCQSSRFDRLTRQFDIHTSHTTHPFKSATSPNLLQTRQAEV
ncbi:hypothetical protein E2C01_057804 [Portunus trituberculatus]|uniref:Uncharacterized protein n=1 Tax=Portunus trituberculatus TaxID=210409 RepID=A0A5B7GXZ3_PORTR|nr:hypothetical protein [Portunus trituberculatus]